MSDGQRVPRGRRRECGWYYFILFLFNKKRSVEKFEERDGELATQPQAPCGCAGDTSPQDHVQPAPSFPVGTTPQVRVQFYFPDTCLGGGDPLLRITFSVALSSPFDPIRFLYSNYFHVSCCGPNPISTLFLVKISILILIQSQNVEFDLYIFNNTD